MVKKYNLEETNENEIRLALYMQDLFDVFFSNKGLQQLIDKTRELLDRPLVLYDSSHKILASSHDAKKFFQFTKKENGSLYMDPTSISYIHSNQISKDHREEPDYQGIICAQIKIDKMEIAKLAVYEDGRQFQDIDFMLMNKVGALYSAHLQRSILINPGSNQIPASLLVDLIEGKPLDNSVLENKQFYLNWARSESIYIMVIAFNQKEAFDGRIPVAFHRLKSFISIEQYVLYKSRIVAFIDDILFAELFGNPGNTFYKLLEENNLSVGVSRRYSLLTESKKQYENALSALEIGRKKNIHCSFFEDCTLYIIGKLISARFDPMDLCHPGVIMLLEYDRKNGTELLETLKQYIFYSSAPAEAARVLNIHKNTLFYRIGKIKDMTGIKLEHGDETCKVYLSIRLLEIKAGNS